MKKLQRPGFSSLLLLPLSMVLALACQRLDPNLSSGGRRLAAHTGVGGSGEPTDPGTGGSDVVEADCPSLRSQAYTVLQTNCAFCHQAMPANYPGTFNFILNLDQLTSTLSPSSSPARTVKYVVGGSPDDSYIFQRADNGSMPPITRSQRPTRDDVDVLRQWITSCIDDPTSPDGWAPSGSTPDAGPAGPALERCGLANVCPDGACCVFGLCRPNGTTCGQVPAPVIGDAPIQGLPGTCTDGACENANHQICGRVDQPCCDTTCTAPRASCLTTDMSKCSACGGTGQPCCKPTVCLAGHTCAGAGVGRVGTCELCGALDQPCCGSGPPAAQRCDGDLRCVTDTQQLAGVRCTRLGDAGAPRDGP